MTDVPGLYLALSEALLGPGHYFGRCYDAFRDCLGGGWGVGSGFTLVWHDAHVAHGAMRELFLDVVKLLRGYGNRVEPDSTVDGIEEIDRIMEFPDLVDRWLHGWAAAARLTTLRRPNSWHVRVNHPGRRTERILTKDDGSAAWHASQSGAEDWLTVPTKSPDEVETAVREAGLTLRPRETFMRRALTGHPAPEPPEGYTIEVTGTDVIEVRVLHHGAEAASGLIAVVGEDAVPHRIQTAPPHRRKGLGSVVMGVLAREAVKAGADGRTAVRHGGRPASVPRTRLAQGFRCRDRVQGEA